MFEASLPLFCADFAGLEGATVSTVAMVPAVWPWPTLWVAGAVEALPSPLLAGGVGLEPVPNVPVSGAASGSWSA